MGGKVRQKLRVERSIYQSQADNAYIVQINRPHGVGQFYQGGINTLEEAREVREEFKRLNPKQVQTGMDKQCCKKW